MMSDPLGAIAAVTARLDELGAKAEAGLRGEAMKIADELLGLGETILEAWLAGRGKVSGRGKAEGFRLLALHRQGARGDPTFNACRETCREIVYHRNVVAADPHAGNVAHTLKLAIAVVRHLALFVGGKMEVAGLGSFCCSSRPIRHAELQDQNTDIP